MALDLDYEDLKELLFDFMDWAHPEVWDTEELEDLVDAFLHDNADRINLLEQHPSEESP
jgi:hypothetical protein